MSILSNQQNIFLDRFVQASARLVVLQNLKQAYEFESRAERKEQINKNFRTSAVLEIIRNILEEQSDTMVYFAELEVAPGSLSPEHIKNMQRLMAELTEYYTWACEQVKLKSVRQSLMKNETNLGDLL